jgi:starvation-inducible DNA-binding protein
MEQLILQLKRILATSFAFYLKSHNYHWNVEGLDFAQHHEFLGNLYEEVYGSVDTTAEKIRMLGAYTPGSFIRYSELSEIDDETNVPVALQMFNKLKADNEIVIGLLRDGIDIAEEAGEPAISNYLQERLDAHQKHAWMLTSLTK